MPALIRTEVLKLATIRTVRLLVMGGVALGGLLGTVTALTSGEDVSAPLGSAAGMANVLGVSAMPGFVMLVLGVLSMAGEYQHRTITPTLLATPDRDRVVASKLVAVALVGLAVALAMMGASLLAALPHVLAAGGSPDLADAEVGRTVAGTLAAGALFGTAGVGVGALFRSQLATVVALGAWVVVAEGVLGTVLGADAGRWFPARAASVLGGSHVEGLTVPPPSSWPGTAS
jgi:ABC-2 type transport system permease protein